MVKLERGEFSCRQILGVPFVTKAFPRGDWIFVGIVQARIEKSSLTMHLEIADKSVPVGAGSPRPRPGVIVNTGQAKCRRNQCGRGLSVWAESFAIED